MVGVDRMKKGKIILLFLIRIPITLLLVVAIVLSVKVHISRQPYRDSKELINAIKNELCKKLISECRQSRHSFVFLLKY